ncbi:aromatic-ring hydroxylase C-terminal domain-containing protein [Streptomyces physcomitrii]|uniref:aromatic-ring hydroxylase C-terminal domain-containing protein n=1 Tax=Streptomyces physcomitrii TaxID=2724184 RepID=UPI0035E42FD2
MPESADLRELHRLAAGRGGPPSGAPWALRRRARRGSASTRRCAPALLVRPDGHIAWAGEPDRDAEGPHAALTHWFGAPAA